MLSVHLETSLSIYFLWDLCDEATAACPHLAERPAGAIRACTFSMGELQKTAKVEHFQLVSPSAYVESFHLSPFAVFRHSLCFGATAGTRPGSSPRKRSPSQLHSGAHSYLFSPSSLQHDGKHGSCRQMRRMKFFISTGTANPPGRAVAKKSLQELITSIQNSFFGDLSSQEE